MRYFYYSKKAVKLNGAHALMVGGDEQCLFTEQSSANKPCSKYEDIEMVYSCEDGNEPPIRYNIIKGELPKYKTVGNSKFRGLYET